MTGVHPDPYLPVPYPATSEPPVCTPAPEPYPAAAPAPAPPPPAAPRDPQDPPAAPAAPDAPAAPVTLPALPAPEEDTPPPRTSRDLPHHRSTELLLTLLAVAIGVGGYTTVQLTTRGALPHDPLTYGTGFAVAALVLVTHVVVRYCAPYADPLLLPVAVLLNGVGLVLVHRLDLAAPGEPAASAQLLWSVLGVCLCTVVVLVLRDHRTLQRYAFVSMLAALLLTAAPAVFPAVNGARLWIRAGGFSCQPAEFAKVLLPVFFAGRLAVHRGTLVHTGRRILRLRLPNGRALGPLVAVWLLSTSILVLERDLGTALLFFGLFVVLLYVATGRSAWLAALVLFAVGSAYLVGRYEPHVHGRVVDWLHPFASVDAGQGTGQLAQSLLAFAAGGLFGTGLGLGHSVLVGFAARSDFILATAGEELGLAGLCALLACYGLLVARGLRTSLAVRDPFGRLLSVGLASLVALQVFVTAGGVTGLVPLTGMALPFLAQGGSSAVTTWLVVALLLRTSDAARRPDDAPGPPNSTPDTAPDTAPDTDRARAPS